MSSATIIHSSISLFLMLLVSCIQLEEAQSFAIVPLSPTSGSSDGAASLVELMQDNFDKRRSRELLGKRSANADGSYERYSRRSHELFGKRFDPEMAIREVQQQQQEENDPIWEEEKPAGSSSLFEQEEGLPASSAKEAAIVNFLIISGYPARFSNSKQLIQKLRQRSANNQEEMPSKTVAKRRNRELLGKRSTIPTGAPLDDVMDLEDTSRLSESQFNALVSFLNAAKLQQPRQRRARGGELFG